jgi:hypothetical protein
MGRRSGSGRRPVRAGRGRDRHTARGRGRTDRALRRDRPLSRRRCAGVRRNDGRAGDGRRASAGRRAVLMVGECARVVPHVGRVLGQASRHVRWRLGQFLRCLGKDVGRQEALWQDSWRRGRRRLRCARTAQPPRLDEDEVVVRVFADSLPFRVAISLVAVVVVVVRPGFDDDGISRRGARGCVGKRRKRSIDRGRYLRGDGCFWRI